jgi:phosphoglycolate phosphatase-like HAD superfamily hydrolase
VTAAASVVFREDAIAPGSEGLWLAALDHLARRFRAIRELPVDELSADRSTAGRELDEWAGEDLANWRQELARFYDDHAGVQLRRDPAIGERLRRLRAEGTPIAAYGVGPREASSAVLAYLGLGRRLDVVVLEPAGDPFAAACAALGTDAAATRHVTMRTELDEL